VLHTEVARFLAQYQGAQRVQAWGDPFALAVVSPGASVFRRATLTLPTDGLYAASHLQRVISPRNSAVVPNGPGVLLPAVRARPK